MAVTTHSSSSMPFEKISSRWLKPPPTRPGTGLGVSREPLTDGSGLCEPEFEDGVAERLDGLLRRLPLSLPGPPIALWARGSSGRGGIASGMRRRSGKDWSRT